MILQKGTEVINKYSLFGELLMSNEPMLLPAFEKSLQDEAKNAIDCWSMIWRSHIISEIQDVLKEDYRFFMTEKEQYEEDRLRIVVNKFEFLFQTVIRNRIFDDSISNYMRFLTHFLPSTDPNNPHLIRRTPLLVLQLNVNPIKKKKENRRGSKKKEQAAN